MPVAHPVATATSIARRLPDSKEVVVMTRTSARCLRLAVLGISTALTLAALTVKARSDFLYTVSYGGAPTKVANAQDFDVLVDTKPEKPNIAIFKGAPTGKGPFISRLAPNTKGDTLQLVHFVGGGPAVKGTTPPYQFGFGLKQKSNLTVTLKSADWTDAKGASIETVPVASFSISAAKKDDPRFTLSNFLDSDESFDVINVSTLVDSEPIDLDAYEAGSVPGFTPQPGRFSLGSGESVFWDVPGESQPGRFSYIQGSITAPLSDQVIGAFVYGLSVVPEPSTILLVTVGLISLIAARRRSRSRAASRATGTVSSRPPMETHRPSTDGEPPA
jgi:hypothetical protein